MRRGQVRHPGHEAGLRDKEKVEDRTPSTLGRFSRPRNSTAQRWCVVEEGGVARGMGEKEGIGGRGGLGGARKHREEYAAHGTMGKGRTKREG